MTPTPWLSCVIPVPLPSWRLVCLPHAGGSASFFNGWASALPEVEVHTACYPGRGRRLSEPPPNDLVALAVEIAAHIEPLCDVPVVLFGHSMGAPVALETARALQAHGVPPAQVFASGSREGEVLPPDENEDDEDELFRRLVEFGGTDPELAADPEFRELVTPYLRGDGAMYRAYRMSEEPVLRCSVTTIVGDIDEVADQRPWSRLTTGPVRHRVVSGDHFYLAAKPPFDIVRSWSTG